MSSIMISGLSAGYGRVPVLEEVDLTVAAGTTTAVLGASGGGKTTLLRAIAGFLRPAAGRILINDRVLSDDTTFLAPHRRPLGYVRQDGTLFPHLDVAGNITFGLSRAERRRPGVVGELLELVGLAPDLACRNPAQLSGGQQQRVALARALARRPEVVLLDEPFSSLDAALRAETRRATATALAESGATALLVTHDQAEALSCADQIAILRDKQLVQVGTPAEVYGDPTDPDLARFLGEAVVLPGQAYGGVARCALGAVRLAQPADGQVVVVLRPEQIRLSPEPDDAGTGPTTIAGVVRDVAFYGHDTMLELELVSTAERVLARLAGAPVPAVGTRASLHVDGTAKAFPSG